MKTRQQVPTKRRHHLPDFTTTHPKKTVGLTFTATIVKISNPTCTISRNPLVFILNLLDTHVVSWCLTDKLKSHGNLQAGTPSS